MSTAITYSAQMNRLHGLERIVNRLDNQFRIPVVGLPFGWDSVVGLIPGIGDIATALPSAFMIYEAARIGARRRTLARMGGNTALDFFCREHTCGRRCF